MISGFVTPRRRRADSDDKTDSAIILIVSPALDRPSLLSEDLAASINGAKTRVNTWER